MRKIKILLTVLTVVTTVVTKAQNNSFPATGEVGVSTIRAASSNGRMHIAGEESLFLLNKTGVIVSKAWGGNGNLTVEGNAQFNRIGTNGLSANSGYPAGWGGGVHTWDVFAEGSIGLGTAGTIKTFFDRDGYGKIGSDLLVKNNIMVGGSNSWILHSPEDGYNNFYIAPGINETGWDFTKGLRINANSGDVNILKNLSVTGEVGVSTIRSATPNGRMHIAGGELLYLLNKDGVIIGKEWGGNGNLQVEGTLLTSRVKVAVTGGANWNWADYVFAKNYQLKPLLEVEAYIKNNQHLEGIPTTQEIEKDGIDIAPVTAKLLEKIEELTLYAIEMKKEIEVLKNKK